MRNTVVVVNNCQETIIVDLDKVIAISKEESPEWISIYFTANNFFYVTVPEVEGMTKAEGIQAVIDRWACGKGRPEFIEGWFDTEGPSEGTNKFLIDLSGCVTFNYNFGFYGRAVTVDLASVGLDRIVSQRHTFWLKADPDKTPEEQGADLEARWRRARGQA